jgi:hypothetical protein
MHACTSSHISTPASACFPTWKKTILWGLGSWVAWSSSQAPSKILTPILVAPTSKLPHPIALRMISLYLQRQTVPVFVEDRISSSFSSIFPTIQHTPASLSLAEAGEERLIPRSCTLTHGIIFGRNSAAGRQASPARSL